MRLVLPVLLLLFTGVAGVRNGFYEYREAVTGGQRFATASEIAYGAVSWVALAALLTKRRWARALLIAWAALVTITASVAAIAWGGASAAAAAAGGISVAAVCGLAVWLADSWLARQTAPKGGGS